MCVKMKSSDGTVHTEKQTAFSTVSFCALFVLDGAHVIYLSSDDVTLQGETVWPLLGQNVRMVIRLSYLMLSGLGFLVAGIV